MAIAVSLVAAAKENDYTRIHVACFAYLVFALLQAVNVARYPDVSWQAPSGWVLAGVLLALFAAGAVGVRGYLGRVRSATGARA